MRREGFSEVGRLLPWCGAGEPFGCCSDGLVDGRRRPGGRGSERQPRCCRGWSADFCEGLHNDALRKAVTQLGTPYSWGGGGPNGPSTGFCDGTNGYLNGKCSASSTVGFDCSSLVEYAYWPAVKLPRTAAEQYGATSDHPVSRTDLQPGDLLFWVHGSSIYLVALYAGDGNVLEAPRTGQSVKIAFIAAAMPAGDYYGATRP